MVDAQLIHFSKPRDCTTPRVNPKVNSRLGNNDVSWRFIKCNNGTTSERMLIQGMSWKGRGGGQVLYGKSLDLLILE